MTFKVTSIQPVTCDAAYSSDRDHDRDQSVVGQGMGEPNWSPSQSATPGRTARGRRRDGRGRCPSACVADWQHRPRTGGQAESVDGSSYVFVALLLWFIPVVGGWLGIALILFATVAVAKPPKKMSRAQVEKNASDHEAWMARASAAQAMHSTGSSPEAISHNPGPGPSQPVVGHPEFDLPPKEPNAQ